MQRLVPAHLRATVTSVRELGTGLVFGAAVLVIAASIDGNDPTPGMVAVVAVLTVGGVGVAALPNAAVPTGSVSQTTG